MKLNLENLPSDSVFLQQIIIDLVGEITSLKEQLKLLKAKRFVSVKFPASNKEGIK